MSTEEIEVCCISCNSTTSTTKNEWARWGTSHIWPVQKPWYTASKIEEEKKSFPHRNQDFDLSAIMVSETSCTHCGAILGGYCKSARGSDARSFKENVFYEQKAIFLRNPETGGMIDPDFRDRTRKNVEHRTRSSLFTHENENQMQSSQARTRDMPRLSTLQPIDLTEPQTFSSRLALQDADIARLYQDIDLLGNKVLALERSMIDLRAELRMSSFIGTGSGQDVLIDGFEAMLGAMKDAKSASKRMEDLISENERLKQELRSISAPAAGEGDDRSLGAGKAEVPSTAPVAPVTKKRPYTRRKPTALKKSVTPAATEISDPGSGFVTNHDLDDSCQLGSLAALTQIMAALGEPGTANQARMSNGLTDNDCLGHIDDSGLADLSRSLSNGDSQQKKRERSREETMTDGDIPGIHGRKKRISTEGDDSSLHSEQPEHEQQITEGHLSLPGSERYPFLPTQPQNPALHFDIADTEDMAIDPALRSTSFPPNQYQPAQNVLSSIENPTDHRPTKQQEKTSGELQYDSIHEARIREYKARDALRKRKSRAATSEKKKMDGEDKFKQEEKIKARDKMVKELMEREEMLENDDDL